VADPIVVGVDGSGRSLRALIWAAHEAALWRCSLRIVHVLPRWEFDVPPYPPGRWEEAGDRGRHIVAEAIAIARENYPDLDLTAALPSGAPASVFLAESEHAQVVVLGARGEGRIGDILLGSVSLQVVGHAASPVVVVDHITSGHRRIVVGADGSPNSTAALAYAFQEASLRHAQLQALHAWGMPYPPEPPVLIDPDPKEVAEKHRRTLEEQLTPFRDEYPDVEVVDELVHEKPALALLRASDRADLLVVGSRGRGGFHGLAHGSVSHAILHYSACPVAVVRPHPTPS
jgi:nucleotide-binding universal stress UspA family protein